jgi:hypothetical protein
MFEPQSVVKCHKASQKQQGIAVEHFGRRSLASRDRYEARALCISVSEREANSHDRADDLCEFSHNGEVARYSPKAKVLFKT